MPRHVRALFEFPGFLTEACIDSLGFVLIFEVLRGADDADPRIAVPAGDDADPLPCQEVCAYIVKLFTKGALLPELSRQLWSLISVVADRGRTDLNDRDRRCGRTDNLFVESSCADCLDPIEGGGKLSQSVKSCLDAMDSPSELSSIRERVPDRCSEPKVSLPRLSLSQNRDA
jgi:hypothetical protein